MKRSTVIRLILAAVLVITGVVASIFLPVREYVVALLKWTQDLGAWGGVVLGGVYILATVLFFPGSVITLGIGFIFGVFWGTVIVSIGSTLGAAAAFLVGRFLARDFVESKIEAYPRFRAVSQAIDEDGFKIVFLSRLSPVFPFNLLNYAYGVTRVSFREYVLGSWIGMLPGTVMYVYLGAAASDLAKILSGEFEGGPWQTALFIGGLVATVAVTVLVTQRAREKLREMMDMEPPQKEAE